MTAGPRQTHGIPHRIDDEAIGGEHRDTRQRTSGAVVRQNTDANQFGSGTAAGEAPAPADLKTAVLSDGFLRGKNTAGKHHVRAVAIDLIQRTERQAAEVEGIHAKAGDPSGGTVGGGDGLNQLTEFGWRDFIAAILRGHQRTINTSLFKTRNNIVRDIALLFELLAALF